MKEYKFYENILTGEYIMQQKCGELVHYFNTNIQPLNIKNLIAYRETTKDPFLNQTTRKNSIISCTNIFTNSIFN